MNHESKTFKEYFEAEDGDFYGHDIRGTIGQACNQVWDDQQKIIDKSNKLAQDRYNEMVRLQNCNLKHKRESEENNSKEVKSTTLYFDFVMMIMCPHCRLENKLEPSENPSEDFIWGKFKDWIGNKENADKIDYIVDCEHYEGRIHLNNITR